MSNIKTKLHDIINLLPMLVIPPDPNMPNKYLRGVYLKYLNQSKLTLVQIFRSLLITAIGHIKLTDFGLSKIGLMNCKLIRSGL